MIRYMEAYISNLYNSLCLKELLLLQKVLVTDKFSIDTDSFKSSWLLQA